MSFERSSDLEAQHWGDEPYRDHPSFDTLATELDGILNSVMGNVKKLEEFTKKLGTKEETPRTRGTIGKYLKETTAAVRKAQDKADKVSNWQEKLSTKQQTEQKSLISKWKSIDGHVQTTVQSINREQQATQATRAALEDESSSASGFGAQSGSQQQLLEQEQERARMAPQHEVDFNETLINDRQNEIDNIADGVQELNDLFKNLGHVVHEQGEQLNFIEENVETTREATQGGYQNLRQADRYQRSARGKGCWLLIIMAVVLTIIILAVVID
ncbi:t-SNARE [Pseudovirgaria hyperparasitica]|uniref:t-SNARE n=1 Tax=Pseudovirgaria hyperparasitica TaxID=470096 RepID=A0A6A6WD42_9PEZI|nr:t-SNARE [Pseudovirgaria hyperparasitica]KAF2759487.1 t-SNARE [Pseudovirgaria hyperparasitica]